GLVWRQRSMVRPETLAAVLLGLELWILETRRNGGRDHAAWLVLLLWLWVQAHVSFVLGFAVLAIYAADAMLAGWRRARGRADFAELALCALLSATGLGSQRCLGFYALVAAPFVARDLESWWAERRRPAAPVGWRAAIATAAILVALCVPEWSRPEPRLGV